MIIHAISDLHGEHPELPGGDLLIIAGDCTTNDSIIQWELFNQWLDKQNAMYRHIIMIAGNHDGALQHGDIEPCFLNACYLQDEMIEWEGLKIYGSPWTPTFFNWHFMLPRGEALKKKWDLIPYDLDILITHGPPMGVLDGVKTNFTYDRTGCYNLMEAVQVKKPKVHIFGHIHAHGGKKMTGINTTFYNVACLNEDYELVRGVTEIIV